MTRNPYKPPLSWKEALHKPCIEAYNVEEENDFVCVDLAPGWKTSEGTISLHCHWDEDIPLAEYELKGPTAPGCLPIWREVRYIGVTEAHMQSALEALQGEWSDLRYDP